MNLSKKLKARASSSPALDLFPELSDAEKAENKILVDIAEKIISQRKKLGYSQKTLAQKLGVSQSMISQYEDGNYNFTISSLCKLLYCLGLQPSVSFSETDSIGSAFEVAFTRPESDEFTILNFDKFNPKGSAIA